MKEPFIYGISRYELNSYANSFVILPKIQAEKEEVVESLYDDISPRMSYLDEDLGQIITSSVSVEDYALNIIAVKEGYDRMLERHSEKAKLFEKAMNELSPRELDVIRVYYLYRVNDLGLTQTYFMEVLKSAEEKLCNSICELQQNKFQLIKISEHNEKLKKIAEFKKAN